MIKFKEYFHLTEAIPLSLYKQNVAYKEIKTKEYKQKYNLK